MTADPRELQAATAQPTGELLQHAKAPATWKAWEADAGVLTRWATARGLRVQVPIDPQTLVAFVEDCAGGRLPDGRPRAVATVQRYVASVAALHRLARSRGDAAPDPSQHPLVQESLAGLRRRDGVEPRRRVRPFLVAQLQAAARALPDTVHGHRDRALLVLGWAMGARADELVALRVADVEVTEGVGALVRVRRSKTDQEGKGRTVEVPWGSATLTCPCRSIRAWLAVAYPLSAALERPPPLDAPLFLEVRGNAVKEGGITTRTVNRAVKRAAEVLGFNPDQYGAHSLRAGLVTEARRQGKADHLIMRATGHRRADTLNRYDRPELRGECAASGLGL